MRTLRLLFVTTALLGCNSQGGIVFETPTPTDTTSGTRTDAGADASAHPPDSEAEPCGPPGPAPHVRARAERFYPRWLTPESAACASPNPEAWIATGEYTARITSSSGCGRTITVTGKTFLKGDPVKTESGYEAIVVEVSGGNVILDTPIRSIQGEGIDHWFEGPGPNKGACPWIPSGYQGKA